MLQTVLKSDLEREALLRQQDTLQKRLETDSTDTGASSAAGKDAGKGEGSLEKGSQGEGEDDVTQLMERLNLVTERLTELDSFSAEGVFSQCGAQCACLLCSSVVAAAGAVRRGVLWKRLVRTSDAVAMHVFTECCFVKTMLGQSILKATLKVSCTITHFG